MLRSEEYKLVDIYKFMAGFSFSLKCLWPEVMEINILEEVDSFTFLYISF